VLAALDLDAKLKSQRAGEESKGEKLPFDELFILI